MCTAWLTFWSKKNSANLSDEIDDLNEETGTNLEILNRNILGINNLLETYKKVIDEKNEELKKYKEGSELLKQKGLFVSLIDILEFINNYVVHIFIYELKKISRMDFYSCDSIMVPYA